MLQIFRKFQRTFFIAITVVIAISFTFFGVDNRTLQTNQVKRVPIVKALDESQIYLDEIRGVSRFLNAGYQNPVFIDLVLKNGIARKIAEYYFDQIQEDLAQKLKKAQHFMPYEHFSYKELSAKNVWRIFYPTLLENFEKLINEKQVTMQTFDLLASLYLDQTSFTPELLKRILVQNLKQIPNNEDPRLAYQDLSLFGFTTTAGWFGESFLDLISQIIINVSRKAEKEGYVATDDQLRQDFLQTFQKEAIGHLEYDEAFIVKMWKPIYLFKVYTEDLKNSVLHDRKMFENLSLFNKQKAKIICYSLPKYFEMDSFLDLLKLQTYLDATTNCKAPLDFSCNYKPIQEIAKDFPELIEKTFHVKIKKFNKKDLALEIPLKKMWQWQSQSKNWKLLCEKFSFLDPLCEEKGRFSYLQKLSPRKKEAIDLFSRDIMLSQDSIDIDAQFSTCTSIEKTIKLKKRQKEGFLEQNDLNILQGIEDFEKLYQFLSTASLKQEQIYTENDIDYYSFIVLDRTDEALLLFQEASSALDELLKEKYKHLKQEYPTFFQDEKGQFKPIHQASYQMGRLAFSELWKKYTDSQVSTIAEFLNGFKQTRLQEAQASLIKDCNESTWISSDLKKLEEQWKLIKENKIVEQDDRTNLSKQVFATENAWSCLFPSYFFYVQEKTSELDESKVLEYKENMSEQFLSLSFKKLLEEMEEKKSVALKVIANDS